MLTLSGCGAGGGPVEADDCETWNALSDADKERWVETTNVEVPPELTFYAEDGAYVHDGDPVGLLTDVCALPGEDIPSLSLASAFSYQTDTLTCSDWVALPQMGKDGWTAGFSAFSPADDTSEVTATIESVCAAADSSGLLLRELALNPSPPADSGVPAPSTEVILVDEWTDGEGYAYAFELRGPTSTVTSDVLNAKPGYVLVDWSYASSGTVANMTPGRNAPLPALWVQPIWDSGSALCTYAAAGDVNFRHGLSYSESDEEDRWCTLTAALQELYGPDAIAVDSSAPVDNAGTRNRLELPEEIVDALIADLQSPTGWVLGRDRSGEDSGSCSIDMGTVYVAAASTEVGCD